MNELLHAHGLKITPLRLAVLKKVKSTHSPLSANEIAASLKDLEFDRATLFRCLKQFVEAGLLHTVDLGEGHLRYEAHCETHHHHHHIICNSCKAIEVVPVCIPDSVIQGLKKKGYKNITHRIDFTGLCKKCA